MHRCTMSIGRTAGHLTPNTAVKPPGADAASKLVNSVRLALGSEVLFDWLSAAITDPESGLTTTIRSPDQEAMRFGCADPGARVAEVGGVPAAVRQRDPVVLLSTGVGAELGCGRRYWEFLRLNAVGHELRAALAVGDLCWGFLVLQRGEDCPAFSAEDVELVRSRLPGLSEELGRELLGGMVAGAQSGPPGFVVVDSANTVRAMSPRARALIARTPAFHPLVPGGVPVPVACVADRLRRSAGRDGGRVLVPDSGEDGWFAVSGSRVDTDDGDRHFVVSLEPAGPADLTPLILRTWGLTTRESAVTQQVIKGLSTTEIAESLGISRHTVQDHLKAVFAKTGVRSRRDLARTVGKPPPRCGRPPHFLG